MSSKKRRFVFTDFNTLQHVDFAKLTKVCDKLFVMIHQQEKLIPLPLVLAMQQFGKNAKWIVTRTKQEEELDYHLCYVLGKLDEKVDGEIDFAILSERENLDPVIDFINTRGRNCLRVTMRREIETEDDFIEEEEFMTTEESVDFEDESELRIDLSDGTNTVQTQQVSVKATSTASTEDRREISTKAKETVERLKYTGNRPAEVVLLRDYISLFHQELEDDGQADEIINNLVENKQIEVKKGVIKYNF